MYLTKGEVVDTIITAHLVRMGIARLVKPGVYNVKPAWFMRYESRYLYGWLQGLRAKRVPPHLVDLLEDHDVTVPKAYRRTTAGRS